MGDNAIWARRAGGELASNYNSLKSRKKLGRVDVSYAHNVFKATWERK